jgi:RND family efflux transporter MFP subunit
LEYGRVWARGGQRATLLIAGLLLAAGVAAGAGASAQPATATQIQAPSTSDTWSDAATAFSDLEWVTRPSRDSIMSLTVAGEIAEIPVKPGQRVRKGEVLVQARDAEAQAGLAVQRVRAANEGEVRSAKASLELAEVRYKRILEADAQGAGTPQELDERRVSVDAARASLMSAEHRLREERERVRQLEEAVRRYRIEAPFDGIVENIAMDVGATVEPPNPVLRVVNIDVLWIDLPVPTGRTISAQLAQGKPAWVLLDLPGQPVLQGRVLHVSPVADAAAETRRVRVEVLNPQGLPPGTRARVRFEAPIAPGVRP